MATSASPAPTPSGVDSSDCLRFWVCFRVKSPSRSCFPAFIPHFLPLFCRTNPTRVFPNLFIPQYFHIFQLGSFGRNTLLYREPSPVVTGRDATPQASLQGEPSGRERVQSCARHHFAGFPAHVSMIHAHTPILPLCLQTSKCTLEGLEGLEAFLFGSQ